MVSVGGQEGCSPTKLMSDQLAFRNALKPYHGLKLMAGLNCSGSCEYVTEHRTSRMPPTEHGGAKADKKYCSEAPGLTTKPPCSLSSVCVFNSGLVSAPLPLASECSEYIRCFKRWTSLSK